MSFAPPRDHRTWLLPRLRYPDDTASRAGPRAGRVRSPAHSSRNTAGGRIRLGLRRVPGGVEVRPAGSTSPRPSPGGTRNRAFARAGTTPPGRSAIRLIGPPKPAFVPRLRDPVTGGLVTLHSFRRVSSSSPPGKIGSVPTGRRRNEGSRHGERPAGPAGRRDEALGIHLHHGAAEKLTLSGAPRVPPTNDTQPPLGRTRDADRAARAKPATVPAVPGRVGKQDCPGLRPFRVRAGGRRSRDRPGPTRVGVGGHPTGRDGHRHRVAGFDSTRIGVILYTSPRVATRGRQVWVTSGWAPSRTP